MSLRRASFSRAPPYLPSHVDDDDDDDMDLEDQLADDHPSDGESEVDHDDPPPPPLPAGTFQSPAQPSKHYSKSRDDPVWREQVWRASPAPSPANKDSRPRQSQTRTPDPPPGGIFGVLKAVPGNKHQHHHQQYPPARYRLPPPNQHSHPPPTLPPMNTSRPSHSHTGSPWLYAGEEPEYDDDEDEEHERPKKRRRTRVALSCAECKRRKIKCDRAQPCTPCARRGDQSNCKWAVIEAKDGTPTRAEFETLQARLAHLERMFFASNSQQQQQQQQQQQSHPQPPPAASTPSQPYQPIVPSGHTPQLPILPRSSHHHNQQPQHPPPPTATSSSSPPIDRGFARGGSTYATNGPVYPPPAPMAPAAPPPSASATPGSSSSPTPSGSRTSPIKVEDPDSDSRTSDLNPPAVSNNRPTLRLLPEALRRNGSPGRLSGTTFPLSDADWEAMTSVALTGANKQRPDAGSMHVDVQRELEALVATLPSKDACDRIWGAYVARLEWQHCIVHPGAFQQMYDTFWAFKTHAERAACTPIAWFALLLIVMSQGLGTMRPSEAKKAGISEDTAHWRMLCTQLWIASERALALDNFSHAVTLEVVQTLVLLSHRAISLDPKGWFHQAPILAMAIRLAMSIGLSNVPGDKPGEVPPPGLYRRELWRRIWFNIVYLDWRFSVPMGETYFINAFHYATVWPANLDWGDMTDGTVFRPKPRNTFTSSSMFLAKVHNAERVKELCDALNLATRNGHTDVSRLFYEHEVAVNDNIAREPPCLIQVDPAMESADTRVQWARIGHTLELDYRAIQIHRSFLVADFREARARSVCVDTAEKMLRCFVEGKNIDAPSAWWWYGYTACVVLMMEQYYAELQPPSDVGTRLTQKLDDVLAYVAMQRNCEEVTVRAWDGILILETLLCELQKRRVAAAASTTTSMSPTGSTGPVLGAGAGGEAARSKRGGGGGGGGCEAVGGGAESTATMVTTRVSSSSPIHAFRKWILNVMPFLKLAPVPGMPAAHPRQRDMDGVFWDAILDIDTELHKSSRRGNFGKS